MRIEIPSIWVALLLAACGGEESSKNPEPASPGSGTAVLAERARVLDEAGLAALESRGRDGDLFELSFSSTSAVLDDVEEGDVLIIGASEATPSGALLVVEMLAESGDGLVLGGRPAELGEAFDALSIELHAVLDDPAGSTLDSSSPGLGTSREALGLSFPVALSAQSGSGSFSLDGSLSLDSSLDLELEFDFSSFQLDELSLTFSGEETFLAELSGQGEVSFDESTTLGSISFAPITLLIPLPTPPGVVPVVLTPGVRLEAGLRGSIQGDVEASVTQRASFTAGLGYKNGEFGGFSEDDSDFDFEQPTYEASASIKAWAGPRVEVLLYGAAGPYAGVEAFVEAAASAGGPPLCAAGVVDAGLAAKVGVDFIADYSTTLFDHRYPLATFDSCSDDPDAPRPAITWARTFGREGSSGERAKAVIELSDGTYLVVGDSELFEGVTAFGASLWAVRLDPLGNVIWQRAFGALARQGLTRGVAEVDGGFLVLGSSGVMKLDSGGNPIWAKSYASDDTLELVSIASAGGGDAIVAGIAGSPGRAFAMKLDAAGDVVWARGYAGDDIARVRSTADGGALLVGKIETNADDLYLAKIDAEGELLWQRAIDNLFDPSDGEQDEPVLSSSIDRGYDAVERPGGGYVVVGESYGNFPLPESTAVGFSATWVLRLGENGELAETGSTLYRAPESAEYGGAYAVGVRENGNSVVLARRADTEDDLLVNEDVLVIQDGAVSLLGGAGNDAVYSGSLAGIGRGMPLQMTSDGGSVVAVTSDSFAGQDQFWVVKLNRTAGIAFDYRSSVAAASFNNSEAVAVSLSAGYAELEVAAESFRDDIVFEDTGVVSASQSP